ncbi:MAG: methyltransferase domain-containing protein [Pseudomonadota bacterium]
MQNLTDRPALLRNRARARTRGMADFLHRVAIDEVQDRIGMVNKPFTDVAIVTGHGSIWSEAFPDAQVVPDDETLALEPLTCDLVIHAMALHWASDPVGQLIQCRRALRPDGVFLGIAPGGQTLHELRACLAEAEIAASGGLSPRVAPMGEVRDLGALLQRAGLNLPVADSLPLRVVYPHVLALMHDLRAMGEANAMADRLRTPTPRGIITDTAARYAETYPAPEGGIEATVELIALTGWAPDESQPKPLRPGSATARLADALGSTETKLPD